MPTDKRAKRSIWTYHQEVAPAVPREGETWYKESTGIGHMFDGTDWLPYRFCRDLSNMYGDAYFNMGSIANTTIDYLRFSDESISSITSTWTTGDQRPYSCGCASLVAGYFIGGLQAVTTTDKLTFSDQAVASLAATLSMASTGHGFESRYHGYRWFQSDSTQGPVAKLTFSNDSLASTTTTPTTRSHGATFASEDAGFHAGGTISGSSNNVWCRTQISKMVFAGDTMSELVSGLSNITTNEPTGLESSERGYRFGGVYGISGNPYMPASRWVDFLEFANETVTLITSANTETLKPRQGIHSLEAGYVPGWGQTAFVVLQSNVQKLLFETNTISTITSTITVATYNTSATEGVRFW